MLELGNEAVCWAREGLSGGMGGGGGCRGWSHAVLCLCYTLMYCPGAAANSPRTHLNRMRWDNCSNSSSCLTSSVGALVLAELSATQLLFWSWSWGVSDEISSQLILPVRCWTVAACSLTSLACRKPGNPREDICAHRKHLFLSSTQIWWLSWVERVDSFSRVGQWYVVSSSSSYLLTPQLTGDKKKIFLPQRQQRLRFSPCLGYSKILASYLSVFFSSEWFSVWPVHISAAAAGADISRTK